MERRNRSIKALEELTYIDSLDDTSRASGLKRWSETYFINENFANNFDLEFNDLKTMEELFFKNISFLKLHSINLKKQLIELKDMQKFFV